MKNFRDYLAIAESLDISPEREQELMRQANERMRVEDPQQYLGWLKARFEKKARIAAEAAAAKAPNHFDLVYDKINAEVEYLKFAQELGKKVPQGRKPKPEQFKTGRPNDFFEEVVKAGMYTFGADRSDFDPEVVKEWVARHRKLFKKGIVRAYRTLQVEPSWVKSLAADQEVGQHWTWDLDTSAFNGFDMRMSDRSKPIVTIEVDIETRDIHPATTVAYNCCFEHEKELFLQGFARPVIVSIRPFDFDSYKVGDENLRPDLVGQTLRP